MAWLLITATPACMTPFSTLPLNPAIPGFVYNPSSETLESGNLFTIGALGALLVDTTFPLKAELFEMLVRSGMNVKWYLR